MLTAYTLGQDDLKAKASTFVGLNGGCRKRIPLSEIAAFLKTFPAEVRNQFAFNELYRALQECKIEFGSDCGLWDALELSYGKQLKDRPSGCPRRPELACCMTCTLPPLKSIRCWWLYALGGAVVGTVATAIVYRRRRRQDRAVRSGRLHHDVAD